MYLGYTDLGKDIYIYILVPYYLDKVKHITNIVRSIMVTDPIVHEPMTRETQVKLQ